MQTFDRDEKVKIRLGAEWRTATYIEFQETTQKFWESHRVQFSDGKIALIDDRDIKRLDLLPDNAAQNFGIQNGTEVIRLINEAQMELIPAKHRSILGLDPTSGIIYVKENGLSVVPVVIEKQTIVGWQQVAAWEVQGFAPIPATRDEPEGGDMAPIGQAMETNIGAASLLIKTWMDMIVAGHFENVGLEGMYQDHLIDDQQAREYFALEVMRKSP
jgi:hypothetical protein